MEWASLNGVFQRSDQPQLRVQDRGFRYGDGVFETFRMEGGAPRFWPWHKERLEKGLAALGIDCSLESLPDELRRLARRNGVPATCLGRIAISRGYGGRGYLPPSEAEPNIVIEMLPLPPAPCRPARLWLSRWRKPPPECFPQGIKSASALASVLARREAEEAGCDEALQLSLAGDLAETSSANLFWVREGALYTPSPETGLLPGIMRRAVMQAAGEMGLTVQEMRAPVEALEKAEGVFMTNIAWGVWPVEALEPCGCRWSVHPLCDRLNQRVWCL